MGIRMLPVDEPKRLVNALEISTMTEDGSGNYVVVQSGGTISNVSVGHPAFAVWKEVYQAGWRYMTDAEIPETARIRG